ncbi:androgen-induced gene 1 protein-like isoform X4 [Gopherus flavomarginatus]|uniref:androgen-induced gene 1 protein-like isoform X4 n=1 Tax=Gopherus flavomarginatus TaxID=286002 RepID=UPI0021CBF72E|nr:androgen-induced gene 1 protein-like isoform X4 [Gopherus flavomarginatus]
MAARLMSLVHLCCFLWASFSLSQNVGMPHSLRRESENTYGGRWKYLTFINQILQTLLFGLCVIIDFAHMFIPATKKSVSSRLLPPRDFIFSVLVFPVGLHTTILPLLLIELITCPHKYLSKLKGMIGLSIFGTSYLTWVLWVNYASGIWAYPILEVLGVPGKAVLFSISYLVMIGFYLLGEHLTKFLWGDFRKYKK